MHAFERSQDKGDLKLTQEEAEKFKTAFEDPEFCKLMSEYVADLQNPEYRAETEAYIGQLESEDKVPQGKELIRPQKGFVAKSRKKDLKDKEETKVFINIVQSDKITKPTKTDTAKGQNWSLPYSLGPPHMEKDNKGDAVVAFDCCFHPDALNMGSRYKAFRDLLVSTAIQGIEEACKRQNQSTTVNKEFHILKGVTYKSGEVPTMMIDLTSKENKWNADMMTQQQDEASKKAPPTPTPTPAKKIEAETEKSAMDMVAAVEDESEAPTPTKSKTKSKPAVKKGFLNNSKNAGKLYPEGSSEGNRGVVPTKPLVEELPEGYVSKSASSGNGTSKQTKSKENSKTSLDAAPLLTAREVKRKTPVASSSAAASSSSSHVSDEKVPKFTLVERGILGLGDFDGGNTSHKRKPSSNRPEELVYKIEIPKVTKASKVELDVGEKELKLTYLDVYNMCIQLPYRVNDKRGGAKFDKAKKLLTITLPVQPFQFDENFDEDEDDTETSDVGMVSEVENENEPVTDSASSSSAGAKAVKSDVNAHGRWLSSENKNGGEDQSKESTADEIVPRVEELSADDSGDGQPKETLAQEIARKAKEALAEAEKLKKETSARGAGKTIKDASAVKVSKSEKKDSVVAATDDNNTADYIPSGTYVGSKKGYVFKKGENGMGYYRDHGGRKALQQQKESKATPSSVDALDNIDINKSAISVNTDKENTRHDNMKAESDNIDWQDFPFQFRQTKAGVAMIIDVKNIIEESVDVHFNERSFDVSFTACVSCSGRDESKTIDYGRSFDCVKELNVKACKFDVATHNMVVVLEKKVEEFWVSAANGADKGKGEIIASREFSGQIRGSGGNQDKDGDSSSGSGRRDTNTSVVVNATALLQEMKFGAAGLMDLD